MQDRRSAIRHPVSWQLTFDNGEGLTDNISTTGLLFKTISLLDKGNDFRFVLKLPQQTSSSLSQCFCDGRVVRIQNVGHKHQVAVHINDFSFAPLSGLSRVKGCQDEIGQK